VTTVKISPKKENKCETTSTKSKSTKQKHSSVSVTTLPLTS
jgi:hypothetical protein